ncbi:MAG: hypothetical protein Q7R62_03470 [bacterium]|nr:hypothetical protein [bacterium]
MRCFLYLSAERQNRISTIPVFEGIFKKSVNRFIVALEPTLGLLCPPEAGKPASLIASGDRLASRQIPASIAEVGMGKQEKLASADAERGWAAKWLETYHRWRENQKQAGALPVISPEQVVLHVDGRTRPVPEGWRVVMSGLRCGAGTLAAVSCAQFLKKKESFVTTKKLWARAKKAEGFRGAATARALEAQGTLIPKTWQGRRLYFLAQFFLSQNPKGKKLKEKHRVLKLEWNGMRWTLDWVSFDDNIWTRDDYFIVQHV